jgi:mono/diheme cytochrome c family protein
VHPTFRFTTLYKNTNEMRPDLKKLLKNLLLIHCVSLIAVPLIAQSPEANSTLTGSPVYQSKCAKCHGKTAEGRHFGGPSLVSEKTRDMSNDELRNIIANGKGHMPKYSGKLSDAEIETLVGQIKSLGQK